MVDQGWLIYILTSLPKILIYDINVETKSGKSINLKVKSLKIDSTPKDNSTRCFSTVTHDRNEKLEIDECKTFAYKKHLNEKYEF